MMKFDGKSLLLSFVKTGYNNEVDLNFDDDSKIRVFNGSKIKKIFIFQIVNYLNQGTFTDIFLQGTHHHIGI